MSCFFFFFNDTATTEIYPLPLHDALPIYGRGRVARRRARDGAGRDLSAALGECLLPPGPPLAARRGGDLGDRKSTRLNSSHVRISYAVFCLQKKEYIITRQ